MSNPKSASRLASLLLAGTALAFAATPAFADTGRILVLGAGQSQSTPLVTGQRVETRGPATQVMLGNGTILSFVGAGAFTADTDGSLTLHAGNTTLLASGGPVRVMLPGGTSATVSGKGGAGTFNVLNDSFTGNVLAGRIDMVAGGASRGFEAGQAWRGAPGQTPDRVIANAAQSAPPVASQRSGGLAAAAVNGQPVGLGQALAAIGASSDIVAAATRLQVSAQNPSLATFPATDASTLVNYAASLSHLYGAPAFQGAGPDMVRAYLGYLGGGGSPGQFQSDYATLLSRYIEMLRSGGLPSDFSGANEAAINAYLDYIRTTGAMAALTAEDRAFVAAYLDFLGTGGGGNFATTYAQAISDYVAFLQGGGLPSAYTGLSQSVLHQYLEALQASGLLQSLLDAQSSFLIAYLDHLRAGNDPDQFAGLPDPGDPDPGDPDPGDPDPGDPDPGDPDPGDPDPGDPDPGDPDPDPDQPDGVNVRGSLSFAVAGSNGHTSLHESEVVFVDGKPDEIPTGTTIIATERGAFTEVFENDAVVIGRFYDGVFTDGGRDTTLGQNQGVHYAFAKTAGTSIPASGTIFYELIAATKPTFESDATAPGVFDADLAVAYGSALKVGISGSVAMPDDATYGFTSVGGAAAVADTGLAANPHAPGSYTFVSPLTGSGRACADAECTIRFYMTPGGANASYLATTYATNGSERISGAAAFGQTDAPTDPDPVDPVDPPPGGDTGTNTGFTGTRPGQFTFVGNSGALGIGDATLKDGFLTGFTSPDSRADAKNAVVSDGGSTTDLAWARWSDGPITFNGGSRSTPATTSYHAVSGNHTIDLPTTGTINYNQIAATPVTAEGQTTQGTVTGDMAILFGATPKVGLEFDIGFGDMGWAVATTGGVADPGQSDITLVNDPAWKIYASFNNYSGANRVTPRGGACSNICSVGLEGYLFGSDATSAGVYVSVGDNPSTGDKVDLQGLVLFESGPTGGLEVPVVTGTERTNQYLAHAGTQVGFSARNNVTTTTEADGTLNKYVWVNNPVESPERGTSQSLETGAAGGVIGWSRWADGVTAGQYFSTPPVSRTADQGLHLVYGDPATDLPTSGMATYALAGATKPTIRDGSVAPGSVTGAAAVAFGATAKVGIDLQVSIGGHTYGVATSGGVENPAASQLAVGSDMGFRANGIEIGAGGPACPSGVCKASIAGMLAGAGASHLGIAYTLGNGVTNNQVDGAAVFSK